MQKIWIITAMKEEADHIINLLNLKLSKNLKNIYFYENDKYVLVLTWIWKIQASIWTTFLISNYDLEKIINIWIAGNLKWSKYNIWDVFLVNKVFQHDMYLPFDGEHLYYAKKEILIENNSTFNIKNHDFNIIKNAFCLTWDQFIDDENKVLELSNIHNADVIEMEAFSIASVAREFDILDKCIFIKAISDWADNNAKETHMWNLGFAMKNSLEVLKYFI